MKLINLIPNGKAPAGRIIDVVGIQLHGPGMLAIGESMSYVKRVGVDEMHYIAMPNSKEGMDHLLIVPQSTMSPAKDGEKSVTLDFVFICDGHCSVGRIIDEVWQIDHMVDVLAINDSMSHVKRAKIRIAIPDLQGGMDALLQIADNGGQVAVLDFVFICDEHKSTGRSIDVIGGIVHDPNVILAIGDAMSHVERICILYQRITKPDSNGGVVLEGKEVMKSHVDQKAHDGDLSTLLIADQMNALASEGHEPQGRSIACNDVSVKSASLPDENGKLSTLTDCDGMAHVPRVKTGIAAKLLILILDLII